MTGRAQRVFSEYVNANEERKAKYEYIEMLRSELEECTSLVNCSGNSDNTWTGRQELLILEILEQDEEVQSLESIFDEAKRAIERVLSLLGDEGIESDWKNILVMRYLEDMSWRKIAKELGRDHKNVKKSHDRAIAHLDRRLIV